MAAVLEGARYSCSDPRKQARARQAVQHLADTGEVPEGWRPVVAVQTRCWGLEPEPAGEAKACGVYLPREALDTLLGPGYPWRGQLAC